MIWIQFILCAAIIIWSATGLSKYGDVIAEKTGLGRAWIGAILIAGATSLPELASGISAVAWLKAPNLAAGAIMGSNLFNLGLIAVMDLAYQPGSILAKAQDGHILSAGLGILLMSMIALAVLLGNTVSQVGLPGFSIFSILILFIYGFGACMIAKFEHKRFAEVLKEEAKTGNYAHISARKAYIMFILAALIVILAGTWLAYLGDQISATTGLSRSFVGNFFLAVSTSLPEIAASLAAIRLGAIDMAIGNVLGSNLFNITLLAIYDLVDGNANFWGTLTTANAFAAVIAMMMTGIVIISIIYRASPKTPYRFSWDGISLSILYLAAIGLLYWLG
jgi:cation:H+ antiporter